MLLVCCCSYKLRLFYIHIKVTSSFNFFIIPFQCLYLPYQQLSKNCSQLHLNQPISRLVYRSLLKTNLGLKDHHNLYFPIFNAETSAKTAPQKANRQQPSRINQLMIVQYQLIFFLLKILSFCCTNLIYLVPLQNFQQMKSCQLIILLLLTISALSQSNNCPAFYEGDLIQSDKRSFIRGRSSASYTYDFPVVFSFQDRIVQIASTVATIGDFNPTSSGFNFLVKGQRIPNKNQVRFQLIVNPDQAWTSIQISYLVSAREDFAIGNHESRLNTWTKSSTETYGVSIQVGKTLPAGSYNVAVFVSGFSTSDRQFQISINSRQYKQAQKRINLVIFCSASPQPISVTLTYIVFPENHQIFQITYGVSRGESGAYQISGPTSFAKSNKIEVNQFRIANRFLACTGNQCDGKDCILRQRCAQLEGNIFEGKCIFCAKGIVFNFGCSRKCGQNQIFTSRVCVCINGFERRGNDCVKKGSCRPNEILYSGKCQKCPVNSAPNQSQSTCICPQKFEYDPQSNSCQFKRRCPDGFEQVQGQCLCPLGFIQYQNTCIQCPSNSKPNDNQNNCICLRNTQIYDVNTNTCSSKCSRNEIIYNGRCICNGIISSRGVCRQCPEGSKFRPESNTCQCGDGFVFDSANGRCNSRCRNSEIWRNGKCECISGYIRYNNACRACPKSAKPSADGRRCQCFSKKAIYILNTNICFQCGTNYTPNSAGTACVCAPGFILRGNVCVPNVVCDQSQDFVNGQCVCKYGFVRLGPACVEKCGFGQFFDGTKCLCKQGHAKINGVCRPCPPESYPNKEKTRCICQDLRQFFSQSQFSCVNCPEFATVNTNGNSCQCLPGYRNQNNRCVSNCPAGSLPDNSGICFCTGGKVLSGNQCITPVQCPSRSSFNTTTKSCVCNNKNQNFINGQCKPCDQNSSWISNQCICDTGFFKIGSICRICDSRSKYDGKDCICNVGYFGNRDLCTPCHKTCAQCSGPEANQCTACSDISLVLDKGYCTKNTPCQFGFYLDNGQCAKCIDNCIDCSNIFECKTCSIGFIPKQQTANNQKIIVCEQICGDGIKFEQQCDDGNTKSGDGCSSTCQQQQGWFCSGGSSKKPSICRKFIPDQTILTSKGAVNMGDHVLLSVRASYLPQCIKKNECALCHKAIKVNVIQAFTFLLTTISFIPLSQWQFVVKFDFKQTVTTAFNVVIKLNDQFKGCLSDEDFNEQLQLTIDPAFLAKPQQSEQLKSLEINPDTPLARNLGL